MKQLSRELPGDLVAPAAIVRSGGTGTACLDVLGHTVSGADYGGAALQVEVKRVAWWSTNPAEWDDFARQCRASIHATHGHAMGWWLRNPLGRVLKTYELRLKGDGSRIGQCMVGISLGGERLFFDRLQLRCEHAHLWRSAMAAILADLGPGAYTYGWALNVEPSREADFAALSAVKIEHVRPITVQAVEFGRWPTWEQYYKAVSENSKRNAKAALKQKPNLKVATLRGLEALTALPLLARLRSSLSERKKLSLPIARMIASWTLSLICSGRYMMVTYATDGARPLYCYYGGEFGEESYYLEGASIPDNHGAAWHVLLGELQRAYQRTSRGLFIMGYIDRLIHDDAVSGGLLRSREACRVTDFETAIIQFVYAGRVDRAQRRPSLFRSF